MFVCEDGRQLFHLLCFIMCGGHVLCIYGHIYTYIYIYTYIHIYIYIYAVELITWPFFGHFRVNNLAMVELITWPSFFEPIKIGVFGDFWCTVMRGWCQISVSRKRIWSKRVFWKNKFAPFFGGFWLHFIVAA